ncbi:hypothetical protein GCM10025875_17140 [Litorihabitans aurantiacus]|uniref:Mur ligase central domain-containing protein n=1 Tax=Litorihabitans aurantiacus TaxID=1930061 RepID=A0AA38CTC0_9MICO|nr:NAD-binding protein [Litorihabitans aurantiacus]GMA31722.1 hypothetical protein GCM10025875_17140 [Litorihabitans aurantiacus]
MSDPLALRGTAAREALRGARVAVVGLGLTGAAAARTLHALGADVVALDSRPEVAARTAAQLPGVRVLAGDGESALARALLDSGARLAVVSPGIPLASPLLALPRAAGVRLITEFDLAWMIRLDDAPWFFVTGTNGKTTTAQMTSALLRAGGLHAPPLGNMGVAVSTVALEGVADDAGVVRAPRRGRSRSRRCSCTTPRSRARSRASASTSPRTTSTTSAPWSATAPPRPRSTAGPRGRASTPPGSQARGRWSRRPR